MAELTPFVAYARGGPVVAAPLSFDPQRAADAPFLRRLLALDAAFFGPRGQAMPSWVLYDCALAPGVVVGLAGPARTLPEAWRGDAEGDTLVPVAMVTLLPLPATARQLVHTVAWYGEAAVGRQALAAALTLTGARALRVVAGWRTPEVLLFAELAPLRLRTVWTTAHDLPETLTADLDLGAPRPGGARRPLDLGPASLMALQAELEAGRVVHLVDEGGLVLCREEGP